MNCLYRNRPLQKEPKSSMQSHHPLLNSSGTEKPTHCHFQLNLSDSAALLLVCLLIKQISTFVTFDHVTLCTDDQRFFIRCSLRWTKHAGEQILHTLVGFMQLKVWEKTKRGKRQILRHSENSF